MERNQAIIIAAVVAALALFGLKVWSDRAADSDLSAASHSAAQRLARAGGGAPAEDENGYSSEGGAARAGRAGEHGAVRQGAGDSLANGGSAGSRRGGGSPELARAGAPRLGGGSIGTSGSARSAGGAGGGASVIGGSDSGGQLGPKVQQKQNLVDFIAQQPVQPDLARTTDENGDDVALKVDKTADIGRQGGQDQNVQAPADGEGIEISENGKIEFPNYATGDAATISFKIQPEWSGSDQTDNALVEIRQEHEWNNRLELVKNGEFLRFIVTDDTGREADISVRIADWQAGDQHDVQASYGDGKTSLYIDGRLAGTNQYTGNLNFGQSTPMYVGGDHASSNYQGANSTLRGFTMTNNSSH